MAVCAEGVQKQGWGPGGQRLTFWRESWMRTPHPSLPQPQTSCGACWAGFSYDKGALSEASAQNLCPRRRGLQTRGPTSLVSLGGASGIP